MSRVSTDTQVEFRWYATPLTKAIATCAGVALAAAVLGAQWRLIAFAAPLLGVLCSISWQRPVPTVHIHGEPDSQRCFEGDKVRLRAYSTTSLSLLLWVHDNCRTSGATFSSL